MTPFSLTESPVNNIQKHLQERAKALLVQITVLARNDFAGDAPATRVKAFRQDTAVAEYGAFVFSAASCDDEASGSAGAGVTECYIKAPSGYMISHAVAGEEKVTTTATPGTTPADYTKMIQILEALVTTFTSGYPGGALTVAK